MEPNCTKKTIRSEEEKKNLIIRLNKINGQINGIKNMIEEDSYCNDILVQLSAAYKSIKSLSMLMIESHAKGCVLNDIKNGNDNSINEILEILRRFS